MNEQRAAMQLDNYCLREVVLDTFIENEEKGK